jgi:hypothetical protein
MDTVWQMREFLCWSKMTEEIDAGYAVTPEATSVYRRNDAELGITAPKPLASAVITTPQTQGGVLMV